MALTRVLIGSNNAGKLAEFSELLRGIPCDLIQPKNLGLVVAVDETGTSYAENSRLKALAFAEVQPELIVLADDSGLELAAFGGWPGLHSVRFAGPDADDAVRRRLVLERLGDRPDPDRQARFVCAIAVARGRRIVAVAEGILDGTIALAVTGSAGFGYDPIFVPVGYSQTLGELDPSIKNQISHRARALARLRPFLVYLVTATGE